MYIDIKLFVEILEVFFNAWSCGAGALCLTTLVFMSIKDGGMLLAEKGKMLLGGKGKIFSAEGTYFLE